MHNVTIDEFIEKLHKIENQEVSIFIRHKLYGNQELYCCMDIIDDEARIGFIVSGREIYMRKEEIKCLDIMDNIYCVCSDVMEIKIFNSVLTK